MKINSQQIKKTCAEESRLTFSLEDYVKTIFILAANKKAVRVKNIADALHYTAPSVSGALARLRKMGLVEHEKYEYIELTEQGEKIGKQIYEKFYCLSHFLRSVLMIDPSSAYEIACKIEHCITPEIYQRLDNLLAFYETEKTERREWITRQERYLLEGQSRRGEQG
jgi:DtxR family Mn-dependent transcriptional regulator